MAKAKARANANGKAVKEKANPKVAGEKAGRTNNKVGNTHGYRDQDEN